MWKSCISAAVGGGTSWLEGKLVREAEVGTRVPGKYSL